MLNEIQKQDLQGIAALGRNEDTILAHVAPDEMVIPAEVLRNDPFLNALIRKSISKYGVDPNQFVVGNGDMDLNPLTGLPEFGFLSKVFKKIKKVVKKVAPVAMFIPGVGQALGAVGGSLLGKVGLGKTAAGIGSFVGKIPGLSGVGSAITGGSMGGLGSALQFGGGAIRQGLGGLFNTGPMAQQIGRSMIQPSIQQQQFYPFQTVSNQGFPGFGGGMIYPQQQGGFMPAVFNTGLSGPSLGSTSQYDPTTGKGQSKIGIIEDIIKGRFGFGRGKDYDEETGRGQSRIGRIEDMIKGVGGSLVEDGKFSALGAGGLGLLAGKLAYDAAKERQGGLAETPAVTMDALGRYQLSKALGTGGTREEFGLGPAPKALKFAKGGAVMMEELDMRQGGESIGPGTGTSDDIPAMLSDGEFVMTAKATRGAGAYETKKTPKGIELIKSGDASREAGVENMRELMNMFEAV